MHSFAPKPRQASNRSFGGLVRSGFLAFSFNMIALLTGIFYFVGTIVLYAVGIGLAIIVIGLPILHVGALYVIGWERVERGLMRKLLNIPVTERRIYQQDIDFMQTRTEKFVKFVFGKERLAAIAYSFVKLILCCVLFAFAIVFLVLPLFMICLPISHYRMCIPCHSLTCGQTPLILMNALLLLFAVCRHCVNVKGDYWSHDVVEWLIMDTPGVFIVSLVGLLFSPLFLYFEDLLGKVAASISGMIGSVDTDDSLQFATATPLMGPFPVNPRHQ
jgi:hypothetical protein